MHTDPNAHRIISGHATPKVVSVVKGQTQFSMKLPAGAPTLRYGALLAQLKERHDATLIAVADDVFGKGLELNARVDHPVNAGAVIYYIAADRIRPEQMAWLATSART